MDDLKAPHITKEALAYFRRLFPDRAPDLTETDRVIWFNRGAADVVRHMQTLYDQQQEDILGKR